MDEKQKVWRTLSEEKDGGFRVWEVMEYMGVPPDYFKDVYTPTDDGGFIFYQCMHFWTREKAIEYLKADTITYAEVQELIII